jgi:hypothetical protein
MTTDNEQFDKDKVLRRVKKLMAMADPASGATEGERDNALRMAHATLAKYGLTMAQADAAGTGRAEDQKRGMGETVFKYNQPWVRTAAAAIAHLFFCEYFYISRRATKKDSHFFVGREVNVASAQMMAAFVIDSIDKEGTRMARQRFGRHDANYWRSFAKGAAGKVYWRCEELRKTAEAASVAEAKKIANPSTGASLVLASVYEQERKANQLLIQQQVGKLESSKSRQRNTDWSAATDGQRYGEKINLTPVKGGDGKKLLG